MVPVVRKQNICAKPALQHKSNCVSSQCCHGYGCLLPEEKSFLHPLGESWESVQSQPRERYAQPNQASWLWEQPQPPPAAGPSLRVRHRPHRGGRGSYDSYVPPRVEKHHHCKTLTGSVTPLGPTGRYQYCSINTYLAHDYIKMLTCLEAPECNAPRWKLIN